MKKYLMIMTMVLTVHAVMADGVFIVNKDFKAYDWEEFDGSCGTPIGIYVESKGCTLMSSMTYPYCTLADAKAREAKYSEEAHLARMFEFMTMSDVRDLFNKAMNKIWDISGKYMMDYRDPVSDHGLWLSNGKIGYYYYEDGMKYESERNPEENEQSYALLLFNDSFKNRVIKYEKTQVPRAAAPVKAAGPLKVTVQITGEEKSGADEANRRGYSYLVTDMTITVRNTNGNVVIDPSEKFWVSLVIFHSNGKPVEITPILARPSLSPAIKSDGNGNYSIADPSTYKIKYETRWRDLYNALGIKTIKYQYWVSYRGKTVAKSPMRSVTVRNRYVFSEY